jgi:hypothetical protein
LFFCSGLCNGCVGTLRWALRPRSALGSGCFGNPRWALAGFATGLPLHALLQTLSFQNLVFRHLKFKLGSNLRAKLGSVPSFAVVGPFGGSKSSCFPCVWPMWGPKSWFFPLFSAMYKHVGVAPQVQTWIQSQIQTWVRICIAPQVQTWIQSQIQTWVRF